MSDVIDIEETAIDELDAEAKRARIREYARRGEAKKRQRSAEGGTRVVPVTYDQAVRYLQGDLEAFGDEATKRRRRLVLRGFRAGLWAADAKPTPEELYALLREELFGV